MPVESIFCELEYKIKKELVGIAYEMGNFSNRNHCREICRYSKPYEAGKTVSYDEMQPGDLIFYSFTNNGRYKNISHVAVYVGNGKVVEALNERVGVVYRDVASVGKIVVIGRP